jgi:hypothetical protein
MDSSKWNYPIDEKGNEITEYEVKIDLNGRIVMRKPKIKPIKSGQEKKESICYESKDSRYKIQSFNCN